MLNNLIKLFKSIYKKFNLTTKILKLYIKKIKKLQPYNS